MGRRCVCLLTDGFLRCTRSSCKRAQVTAALCLCFLHLLHDHRVPLCEGYEAKWISRLSVRQNGQHLQEQHYKKYFHWRHLYLDIKALLVSLARKKNSHGAFLPCNLCLIQQCVGAIFTTWKRN